jgi:type IV secretory pathway VirB3-like protein
MRRTPVYRALHRPLTYFGVERRLMYAVIVVSAIFFNASHSLLGGLVIFVGLYLSSLFLMEHDPQRLLIYLRSSHFAERYDAAKQALPRVEIR